MENSHLKGIKHKVALPSKSCMDSIHAQYDKMIIGRKLFSLGISTTTIFNGLFKNGARTKGNVRYFASFFKPLLNYDFNRNAAMIFRKKLKQTAKSRAQREAHREVIKKDFKFYQQS